jgi:hypothetical protein
MLGFVSSLVIDGDRSDDSATGVTNSTLGFSMGSAVNFCPACTTALSFLLCRRDGVDHIFTYSSLSIFKATGAWTNLLASEDFKVDLPAFSSRVESLLQVSLNRALPK